jgi:hypothetical protein
MVHSGHGQFWPRPFLGKVVLGMVVLGTVGAVLVASLPVSPPQGAGLHARILAVLSGGRPSRYISGDSMSSLLYIWPLYIHGA